MDIIVHVGKRKFYQIVEAGVTITSYRNPDTLLTTVTVNPLDATEVAFDGLAVGSTTITLLTKDGSNVVQQPIVVNLTILAATVGTTSASLLGSEVDAGTAFPP